MISLYVLLSVLLFSSAIAKPLLFHTPAYQSPVHAEPDDLLLLAGFGFSPDDIVVYQSVENSTKPPNHPQFIPADSSIDSGIAPVVSSLNIPNSLTIRLPEVMRKNQTYVIWVRTPSGEWSDAVQVNDARPLWSSPAYVYATASIASLPRYLKVIGRNLQAADGHITIVKLTGPKTLMLKAEATELNQGLNEFVAQVPLPTGLAVGHYKISVSRDSLSWVPLADQTLEVRADPGDAKEFHIDDPALGGCRPNDGRDDAQCLRKAIVAATTNGGGTIVLGNGVWDLIDANALHLANGEGLRLANGIKLRGSGSALTTLIRHPQWNADATHPAFNLEGGNEIRGIKFRDSETYASLPRVAPLLQLGFPSDHITSSKSVRVVTDVVIAENVFDKPSLAIADAGLPIKNLFVVGNEFGAFHEAIRLIGNRFNMIDEFRIDDAIFAYNKFYPGSLLDVPNRQGAGASELGAGHRVDFSNNKADGSSTEYLNSSTDARGWRSGFFWSLSGNQEMLLISANEATCTGDKVGDGEAISHDNNGNTFAFDVPKQVLRSTVESITVQGPLLTQQNDREVPVASYYVGHWLQVGAGPGLGQVRKIVSYEIAQRTQEVTFKIAPAWDVTPMPGATQVNIGREYWQVYTVANTIDHRTPLCKKSNRSEQKGGGISIWAQTADSVVASNRQFDSDGILFHNQFTARDPTCKECYRGTHYVSFLEIRDNVIDGEYDWDSDCSSSGIDGSLAAAPGMQPLTVNYGLSISHNTINHADAVRGGAIAMTPGWYEGPEPHRWPLVDNALIHHNIITGLWSARARTCRNLPPAARRTAISLGNSSLVWRPVLYANECIKSPQTNNLTGVQQLTRICKSDMPDSCECKQ